MIQPIPIPFKMSTPLRITGLLFLAYSVVIVLSLHAYIAWQSLHLVLGILALPFVTIIQPGSFNNKRYGIAAALLAIATVLLPIKTILFFTISCACFYIIESFLGKINWLPVGMVFLMSPVFQFAANVFSFPIRLKLTSWAGHVMNRMLGNVRVEGNMILSNGNEFSVDPACMGLNMLVTSLLLQLVVIAMYQRKFKLQLAWWQVTGLLAVAFVLNIISNLFRIVGVIWFNVLPGTFMHDVIGIACLLLYVIAPMLWITQWVIKQKGRSTRVQPGNATPVLGKRVIGFHLFLFLITGCAAYAVISKDKAVANTTSAVAFVEGYKATRVTAEIVKLQNNHSLVYIKYIPGFYSADHHPMICWEGSGYLFRQVQPQTIGKQQVYTALLQNGKDQLYTAWWYDNGSRRTIDQLSWRSQMLSGARPYSVVNVTTADKQQLIKELEDIFSHNKFKPLL